MQTFHRSPFLTIHTEGALLPVDLLQRILAGDKGLLGLTPEDYHLTGEKINEAVNRSWNHLQGSWAAFQTSRGRLKEGDPGTTLTRERWLLPLFQELGYGRLQTAKAIEIDGKSYAISHTWGAAELPMPIHLVGCGVDIERRQAKISGAAKSSPHSLVQELLNRDDTRRWGLISNGLRLRVLRDNASLTRQAFLEFDLEAMFSGEIYADFAVLWLVCHQSRLEGDKPEAQWLERWSQVAQDQGTRALEGLRTGVEESIIALGQGFLSHPANLVLRQQLKSGELNRQEYFRQLLRLVYRMIFLFVAEDRDLLLLPEATREERGRYLKFYSTARLRRLAERQRGGRHPDLWQGLKLLTDLLAGNLPGGREIGLPVLGGFLFSHKALPDLETAQVDNQALLNAVRSLAFTQEKNSRRGVDYKNLGSEELGSVYESLLELQPILNVEAGAFQLSTAAGNERKTTGSYYTPSSLIKVLLDAALDPVIDQAISQAGNDIEKQIAGLLALKVCDPASGSGHFLIAAAHRIARRLAQLRSGDEEPSPAALRSALRAVIAHCIYGVDVNPMAVELCKVNLWLESIEPGKPLSFLDAHIQCGDSLVGVGRGLDISEIPDEAFNPAFGDDRATASALKKRNKRERIGQMSFLRKVTEPTSAEDLAAWMASQAQSVEELPEDSAEQVQSKAESYHSLLDARQYAQKKLEYDLWTAAFFWPIPKGDAERMLASTQQELVMLRSDGELDARLVERLRQMAEELRFFHWELAFPLVFMGENSGFDCVLGNPPWERIKIQEEEFFATSDSEIATAPNKAARKKLIDALHHSNPTLATAFEDAKHAADCASKFVRQSGRFPLTAFGDVNTYTLFTELSRQKIKRTGRCGIICPPGIASDNTTKDFFADLMDNKNLISLTAFVNEKFIFTGVLHNFRFCILVMAGPSWNIKISDFVYECQSIDDVKQIERHFILTKEDLELFNPNTLTAPVFRTNIDAEVTRRIYKRVPVLINERLGSNSWQISFMTMFHMANDSGLFSTNQEPQKLPLYEAKMIHQFDHRFGSFEDISDFRSHMLPETPLHKYQDPTYKVKPCYWVNNSDVDTRLANFPQSNWLIGYREVTSKSLKRTAIFTILPKVGVGHQMPLVFFKNIPEYFILCFLANANSLILDYVTRQKIGAASLGQFIVKQLPFLPPNSYSPSDIDLISSHVLELAFTAYDLKHFAEDMGYHGEPFRWDEERRALLRAELDAYYAKLYGLTRDELRYILDPQDVYGPDFPGETFRVLKQKEIRQFGEYRTRRLVLEAWDRLEVSGEMPEPYQGEAKGELPVASGGESEPCEVITITPEKKADIPAAPRPVRRGQVVEETKEQPAFDNFGLYKCEACGKMVMGFDRESHVKEVHRGKGVEWKKIK